MQYHIMPKGHNHHNIPKSQSAHHLNNGQVRTTQFTIGTTTMNNSTNSRPQSMSTYKKQPSARLPIPNNQRPPKKNTFAGSHPLSPTSKNLNKYQYRQLMHPQNGQKVLPPSPNAKPPIPIKQSYTPPSYPPNNVNTFSPRARQPSNMNRNGPNNNGNNAFSPRARGPSNFNGNNNMRNMNGNQRGPNNMNGNQRGNMNRNQRGPNNNNMNANNMNHRGNMNGNGGGPNYNNQRGYNPNLNFNRNGHQQRNSGKGKFNTMQPKPNRHPGHKPLPMNKRRSAVVQSHAHLQRQMNHNNGHQPPPNTPHNHFLQDPNSRNRNMSRSHNQPLPQNPNNMNRGHSNPNRMGPHQQQRMSRSMSPRHIKSSSHDYVPLPGQRPNGGNAPNFKSNPAPIRDDEKGADELPLGWAKLKDEKGFYYFNVITAEKQRNRPNSDATQNIPGNKLIAIGGKPIPNKPLPSPFDRDECAPSVITDDMSVAEVEYRKKNGSVVFAQIMKNPDYINVQNQLIHQVLIYLINDMFSSDFQCKLVQNTMMENLEMLLIFCPYSDK